jgi:M6 family metalloprotease-like protein
MRFSFPALPSRSPWWLALLFAVLVWGAAHAWASPLAASDPALRAPVPRPCLVMPHPYKTGPMPGVGGAAEPYHDWHRLEEGVFETAARPIRTLRVIALLVDFEDNPMQVEPAYFDTVMTYVDQFYTQMSDGQLVIDYTVTGEVYRLPELQSYYGLDDSLAVREAILVRDAVRAADADHDFGEFNTFMLFHAGPGQEGDINNDSPEQIWSVFFRTVDLAFWLPGGDPRGVATGDRTAEGDTVFVHSMVIAPETEVQDGFDFGILGVTAHEFGHRFGLPDLYDTTAPEGFFFAESQGIGAFGLMGAGIWNANGVFPAEMCAWSKFYVGWLRPSEVLLPEAGGGNERAISLPSMPLDRRGGAVRIEIGGGEYFLIENRVRDYNRNGTFDFDDVDGDGEFDFGIDSYAGCEFDWHLPREPINRQIENADGSGLLIWHIDETILADRLAFNLVNSEAPHKGVDLEEADGIQDLDQLLFTFEAFGDPKDAWYAPFATEFTPETTPNTDGYNDARSDVWITDISAPGDTMTFRVRFGTFEAGWPVTIEGYRANDFQPLVVDLDGDGIEEIVVSAVDAAGQGGPFLFRADGSPYWSRPDPVTRGRLNAEPVVGEFGDKELPELVWVSGDTVYVMQGDGIFFAGDGSLVAGEPTPFHVLDRDPGRVRISVTDVNDYDRPEILIGQAADADSVSIVTILSYEPGLDLPAVFEFAELSLPGDASRPAALADVAPFDGGFLETVHSVRTGTGGYLTVGTIGQIAGLRSQLVNPYRFSLGDTVVFSAPVVGDLDGNGSLEIVAADSEGYVHALRFAEILPSLEGGPDPRGNPPLPGGPFPGFAGGNEHFEELPGWPVFAGTLGDDEPSLADIDGDGYLEVLVLGTGRILNVINYNGTQNLHLPVDVDAEERFFEGFLAPLVLDLTGDGHDDLLVPLPDGQVRGLDSRGREIEGFHYLAGTDQGIYPAASDIDDDGWLELVVVEDVTVAVSEDAVIEEGDLSAGVVRAARILVREVGPAPSRPGGWPVYRGDAGRRGRAPAPRDEPSDAIPELADELFVMPNPARGSGANFHYKVDPGVRSVTIEIHDTAGRLVRTLDGTVYSGTDNIVSWDLNNESGSAVAPGLYFARVEFAAESRSRMRMVTFAVLR